MATGIVVSVNPARRGDTLMAATLATDTVLTVSTVVAFGDEDGGRLTIGGFGPFTYTSADESTNTITLAAPVGAVYEAGLDVNLFDPTVVGGGFDVVEYVASVRRESGGEPFPAIIDHTAIPLSDVLNLEGARVEVEQASDKSWYVSRIIAREPRFDPGKISLPFIKLYLAADSAAIPNTTWTQVTGWTVRTGSGLGFFPPTAGGWVRIEKTGRYDVTGFANWVANTSGGRSAQLNMLNIDTVTVTPLRLVSSTPAVGGAASAVVPDSYYLYEGQYVGLEVYQSSGAGLALRGASDGRLTAFMVKWVAS